MQLNEVSVALLVRDVKILERRVQQGIILFLRVQLVNVLS